MAWCERVQLAEERMRAELAEMKAENVKSEAAMQAAAEEKAREAALAAQEAAKVTSYPGTTSLLVKPCHGLS